MNKKILLLGLIITLVSVSVSLFSVRIFAKNSQPHVSENSPPRARTSAPMAGFPSFEDAAERSINAVVHVKSEFLVRPRFYDDYFGFFDHFFARPRQRSPQRVEGFGSGVVISPNGYIITNNHVIQGAETIHVTFNNRRTLPATIVGSDPSTDIALLRVDARDLDYLTFGNSDEVRVGQWVLAVGNPFNLNSTVTAGIVSAKARNINILSRSMVMGGGGPPIESFIQTDAAVNRGNSGGALVNLYGELIGINTAIASTSGVFTGYSFAVPANTARKVSEDLRTFGEVQRAFLGLLFAPMYQVSTIEGHFNYIDGLRIERITPGGAVQLAGLREGDIMMAIDGRPINTGGDFFEIIGQLRPGETVELTYTRNGRTRTANILLQDMDGGTAARVVQEW